MSTRVQRFPTAFLCAAWLGSPGMLGAAGTWRVVLPAPAADCAQQVRSTQLSPAARLHASAWPADGEPRRDRLEALWQGDARPPKVALASAT